jgi:hypothetical protein
LERVQSHRNGSWPDRLSDEKESKMTRLAKRCAVPALVGAVLFGVVGLPAIAQHADKTPAADVNRAKDMAALIEQGQLNLRNATAVAEKHVEGTALVVVCTIQPAEPQMRPGAPQPPTDEQPGPERPAVAPPRHGPFAQSAQVGARRLVYSVSCFAHDEIVTVHVDGLTKQVIEPPTQK